MPDKVFQATSRRELLDNLRGWILTATDQFKELFIADD